jgi:hypothetical protein
MLQLYTKFKDYILIGILFLLWQVCMIGITYFNLQAIPANPENTLMPLYHKLPLLKAIVFAMWNQWDSEAYVTISNQAYANPIHLVFYPFYPILVKVFSTVISLFYPITSRIGGVIASSSFLLVTLNVLFKLCKTKFSKDLAYTTILVLLFFPTSFFLRATYTESLFLMLTVLSFYYAEKKHFFVGAIFSGLASATRLVGVGLIPIILFMYLHEQFKSKKISVVAILKSIGLALVGWGGFIVFSIYQFIYFNSPIATLEISKSYWQRYFSLEHLWYGIHSNLHNFFGQSLRTICYIPGENYHGMIPTCPSTALINLAFTGVFLFWCIWVTAKNSIPRGYQMLAWMLIILSIGSGWLDGVPRYVLPCFPLFISIAKFLEKYPGLKPIYFAVSAIVLTILTLMFTRAEWVA